MELTYEGKLKLTDEELQKRIDKLEKKKAKYAEASMTGEVIVLDLDIEIGVYTELLALRLEYER